MELVLVLFYLLFLIIAIRGWCEYQKIVKKDRQIEKNNEEVLKQREDLLRQIAGKQTELDTLSRSIERDEYLLNSLRKEKTENLEKQFQERRYQLESQYAEKATEYEEALEKIKGEINSLRDTKAAAIAAFQKEEAIRQQADLYRLKISDSELNDIQILRGVQPRLNKPRILSMLIWQTYYQPIAKKNFPKILGKKTACGIYKITSLKSGMCYIGQATDYYKRMADHCKAGLGIDTPQGNKLYAAMLEEGLENFTFELLEECTEDELDKKEKFYIEVYNSVEFGYNGNRGVANSGK